MTEQITPELVERMVALVRTMALADKRCVQTMGTGQREAYNSAAAIIAELPKPVDPDLLEAREIAAGVYESFPTVFYDEKRSAKECRSGNKDGTPEMHGVLAGIKRGRELEREGK